MSMLLSQYRTATQKVDKTKILMTNGSLMKVKNTFDLL